MEVIKVRVRVSKKWWYSTEKLKVYGIFAVFCLLDAKSKKEQKIKFQLFFTRKFTFQNAASASSFHAGPCFLADWGEVICDVNAKTHCAMLIVAVEAQTCGKHFSLNNQYHIVKNGNDYMNSMKRKREFWNLRHTSSRPVC